MEIKQKHKSHVCGGGGASSRGREEPVHTQSSTLPKRSESSGEEEEKGGRRKRRTATKASFSSFEREGEFGSGLPFAQDDFLLLLLLLLTVLLQLHALLVDLPLLLHNPQLLLRLSRTHTHTHGALQLARIPAAPPVPPPSVPVWPELRRSCGYSPPEFFPALLSLIFLPPKGARRRHVSRGRPRTAHTRAHAHAHTPAHSSFTTAALEALSSRLTGATC